MGADVDTETQPARASRDALFEALVNVIADWGAGAAAELRPLLATLLADVTADELALFRQRLEGTGHDWSYNPADPLARRISRAMMERVLAPGSALDGAAALEAARREPSVLVGNHLSYIDVNALDALLSRGGHGDDAERITTLVGPKVFTDPIRRLASLCFGTIKLPQSPSRASGEAVMSARDVARLARQTMATAKERQRAGDHLLVFPEGSRSRNASLQPCLAAVARYLEAPSALLVPFGHTGCERLMPIGDEHVHAAEVRVRLGGPVRIAELLEACGRNRQRVADVVGFLVADLLPPSYRGAYTHGVGELERAREIATALAG